MRARLSMIYTFQVELMSLVGEVAFELVRNISVKYGIGFYWVAKQYIENLGKEVTSEMVLRFLCAETAADGWGRIEIDMEDGEYTITAPNGLPVAWMAQKDKREFQFPVDSFFAGYFQGIISAMERKRYAGKEVECIAKGDSCCKIVVTPDDK